MASLGSTIQRGNILYGYMIAVTITPVAIAQNISAEQTFNVYGLNVTDAVDVCALAAAQTAGVFICYARVSAKDTLAICFGNLTGGSLTPISGLYTISVQRPELNPLPSS